MAADILLYDAEYVPVGNDQLQHIEITRKVASKFNLDNGETFIIPSPIIREKHKIIPGIDGGKMSKSKNNTINIFLSDDELKKQIMSIKTDSISIEKPKDPNKCTVFKIYSLVASDENIEEILNKFKKERKLFNSFIADPDEVNLILNKGAQNAKIIAESVIKRVRKKIGY